MSQPSPSAPAEPGRRRSWSHRLAFATLANGLGLAALGLVVEVVGQVHGRRWPAFDVLAWQADPALGWRLVPGIEFTWGGLDGWYAREFSAPVRVNSLGFRDRERAPGDRAVGPRVALLGDSFFEGAQVPLEDTCAQRLEARLAARHPGAEVLNLGVSNHGVGQALLTWEHVARRFDPGWVVVLVSELTLARTVLPAEEGAFPSTRGRALQIRPWFSLEGDTLVRHPAEDAAVLVELQASLLAGEFAGQRTRRRPAGWFLPERLREAWRGLMAPRARASRFPRIRAATWQVNRRILVQLARQTRAAGSRLALLDVCTSLNPGATPVSAEVRALCQAEGLVYVDGSAALQEADRRGRPTRWRRDIHWTPAGHEAAAAALDEALRAHGVVVDSR